MRIWQKIKQMLSNVLPLGGRKALEIQKKQTEEIRALRRELELYHKEETKQIAALKRYVNKELTRRDNWPKRDAEIQRLAEGRQIWVIKCPSPEGSSKVRWGDYHFCVALKKYLDRLGIYTVLDCREDWGCEIDADVVLVLRGKNFYHPDRRNKKTLYIMWNISHPDMLTKEEYQLYDVICVASRKYAKELSEQLTVPVLPLLQCTDTELFCPCESHDRNYEHDYIFVGNTREIVRTCVLWSFEKKLPIHIFGDGWKKMFPQYKNAVLAESIENDELPKLYRSSRVTLNDHWKDMLEKGFVNNRIFDALACGLPVISDCCEELKDIFPDAVLYYETRDDFDRCVDRIEKDYDNVRKCVLAQRELICEQYSFECRAKELLDIADKYSR